MGKTKEDKKTSLIKDLESHFLLKHQMAKAVSMGLPIHLGFLAVQVRQDEKRPFSTTASNYNCTHTHTHTHTHTQTHTED